MEDQPQATPSTTATEPTAQAPTQMPLSNVPSDERMLAAIGYFPMVFVLPLIAKPKSAFCQLHAKQGMVISVLTFFILFMLVLMPAIGSLLFLGLIASIGIGGFQAYSGFEWKVPVLTDIASKINVDNIMGTPTPQAKPATIISTPAAPAPTPTPATVTPTAVEATPAPTPVSTTHAPIEPAAAPLNPEVPPTQPK